MKSMMAAKPPLKSGSPESMFGAEGTYRKAFEDIRAVVLVIDPDDGRIIDANPTACRFYGYSLPALRAKTLGGLEQIPARKN